ncbi:MAG: formyltransferase family protein [Candidatus Nanoarchaeia archaeon]|nr:formyltransferase family protein [Candidatus Nanoarchaeia archaeon]
MRNIIWLSANKFGFELLKEASKISKIKAIITLKQDSKTIMYDGIDNEKWDDFNIDVYRIDKINEEEELIRELSPDIIVMCGWRQVIDEKILKIPKDYFVGFHPTLLPEGRGPAPIINSIMNNYHKSGLTLFHVSPGLDDGDIIGQDGFIISDDDYAMDVYNKAIDAGRKLIRKYLPMLIQGNAPRMKQDESKATIFCKRRIKDNEIDVKNESADNIYRKIRALSKPYNGAYIKKDNRKIIIWKAELE